jgi:uncharacterized protein YecT (DUF1311 family)
MKKIALLLFFAPLFSFPALAQYSGPAVETCRAAAMADAKATGGGSTGVRFDNDRHMNILRYTRKAGSQPVSSLLYGNGAILLSKGPPVEMSFLCVLANDKQAVLFFWSPRPGAPALKQCTRDPAQKAAECIDTLLQVTEADLTTLYSKYLLLAQEEKGGSARVTALRKSNDAFRAYMDAECARRGAAKSDANRACIVDLTRRRLLDLE